MRQFTKKNPFSPWIKAVEMYRNIETNELSCLLNTYRWTADDIGNEEATCSTTTAISPDERYLAVGYAIGIKESANKSTYANDSSLGELNDISIFNSLATDGSMPRQSPGDHICVRIFEIFTGRAVCVKHLICTTVQATKITCLAWSFDQQYLYAGNQDCTVLWFDLKRSICTPIKQICVNSSCKEYVIARLLSSQRDESKILVTAKPKKSKSNVRGHNSNDRQSHLNRMDKIQNNEETLVYLLDANNDDFAPIAKNYAVKAAIFVNDDQDILLFISESNNIVDHERKTTTRSKMQSSKKNQAMLIYNIDTKCIRATTSAPFPTDFNNVKVDSIDLRFEWLSEIKRILVSSNIGFYFIDLNDTYTLPTLFHSKFIDGRYQNFYCGKILFNHDDKSTYLLGFRDHDKDPGGREKNSICIWNIWNPVQMMNCPITIPKTKYHQKNDYFSCMNVQNSFRSALFFTSVKGRLACFRKIRSVSSEWGGAMFPARFQVIDVNKRYVESESEFDLAEETNLGYSGKIAEPHSRGKLNVLLARDTPEINDTVNSSTYFFARPSKNVSLLINKSSDSVESNPIIDELRPKPGRGEMAISCRVRCKLGVIPGFNVTSQMPHNEMYHGIFQSSVRQRSHLSDNISPLSDNNTSKHFRKTLSPKSIDEGDPAKLMQKVHAGKLLEYALQRKEKLKETPALVPRLAQHYSQYVDAYINSLSCDDFKLFLLLAKPSLDREEIMAHFPGLTQVELTGRAKRLGFKISYSKHDEKLHREVLKPNVAIKNESKAKDILAKSNLLHWSDEEDTLLISYIANNHVGSWSYISTLFHNRSPQQCFRRAFLLLGHETAFSFDSFLQVRGTSARKLKVRINPQNLMDLEEIKVAKKPRKAFDEWIQMTGQHAILKRQFPQYNFNQRRKHLRKIWFELPDAEKAPYMELYRKKFEKYKLVKSKAVDTEDAGENSLEEPSKKAFRVRNNTKSPLVVDGVVVKRPRQAYYEWMDATGQGTIVKRKFPQYNYNERRKYLSKLWAELPDAEKAPYVEIYRKKFKKYEVLKSRAVDAEGEDLLKSKAVDAEGEDSLTMPKPISAFDEWVGATGQNQIAKNLFPESTEVENRNYLEQKWLNDISENEKLQFSELYNYKLREYLAKQKLLTLFRQEVHKDETGLAYHQKKKLAYVHATASNVVRSTCNQQNLPQSINTSAGQDGSSILKINSEVSEEPSIKAFRVRNITKSPRIAYGVAVKKPRKAFDEWIQMTGQHAILKRQFPQYNYHERRKHLRKIWLELPDAEKAPYMELYRKKYEKYKLEKSKAVATVVVKRPRNAFAEWMVATGQSTIAKRKFPQHKHGEIRTYLHKLWDELPDAEKAPYREIYKKNFEEYKLLKSTIDSEGAGENSLEKPSEKALRVLNKTKSPHIASGVAVKKPRKAFDEWIQMTGQNAILKRHFPQYNYSERRKHLSKLWDEMPDAEKAPYMEIYRKKYEKYKLVQSKAVDAEDTGEDSPEGLPKKNRGKRKAPLVVSNIVKRPRTAFDEWVSETGQADIAKTKFPQYSARERRRYMQRLWATEVPDVVKAPFLEIYRQKRKEFMSFKTQTLMNDPKTTRNVVSDQKETPKMTSWAHTRESNRRHPEQQELNEVQFENSKANISDTSSNLAKQKLSEEKINDFTITADINNDRFCHENALEDENIVKSKSKAITNAYPEVATNMGFFHQDVVTATGAANVACNRLNVFLEKCFNKTNIMQCTWANIFALAGKKIPNTIASLFMESENICYIYKDIYDLHKVSLKIIAQAMFVMDKIAAKPSCNKDHYAKLLLVNFQHFVNNDLGLENPIAPYVKRALRKDINLVRCQQTNKSASSTKSLTSLN